jgi:hypothetical protein
MIHIKIKKILIKNKISFNIYMDNNKKIILIIIINILLITMGIYYYKYMSSEYKIFINKNKLRITTLGVEEAAAVLNDGSAGTIYQEIVTSLSDDISSLKNSLNRDPDFNTS